MKITEIIPRFVEFIPENIEEGVLYISETYQTAIHKCCCGCGEEVVTPLNPADWQLHKYRGKVSITPSIGNWNYPCQSHYWIHKNRIEWSTRMSKKQIRYVQARDKLEKEQYIAYRNSHGTDKKHFIQWIMRIFDSIKTWWR